MMPFMVVKTRWGVSYVRPDRVLAVNASDAGECTLLLTDGVAIEAAEPAEDVVARLEARAADEAPPTKEKR